MTKLRRRELILFADGLTLVYHEARHVRFLVKDAHITGQDWNNFVSLPKNRIEAWKGLQSLRQAAACKQSADEGSEVFRRRLVKSQFSCKSVKR